MIRYLSNLAYDLTHESPLWYACVIVIIATWVMPHDWQVGTVALLVSLFASRRERKWR